MALLFWMSLGKTCIFRAWKPSSGATFLCPAMNTQMWDHPITEHHLNTIRSFDRSIKVLDPTIKHLACGDTGKGALCDIDHIVGCVHLEVRAIEAMK